MAEKHNPYVYLIGSNKKTVINELGDDFNYYPSDIWHYTLKRSWWGRRTTLEIYFKHDTVVKVCTKKNIKKRN